MGECIPGGGGRDELEFIIDVGGCIRPGCIMCIGEWPRWPRAACGGRMPKGAAMTGGIWGGRGIIAGGIAIKCDGGGRP